jgi:hypothetical protein
MTSPRTRLEADSDEMSLTHSGANDEGIPHRVPPRAESSCQGPGGPKPTRRSCWKPKAGQSLVGRLGAQKTETWRPRLTVWA